MAGESTGRPVGRPKGTRTAVVELETVSFKAPKEFIERVKRYAKQRSRPVSELVRDGLEWRITEGDPRSLRDAALQAPAYAMNEYYGNSVLHADDQTSEHTGVLHAILAALARQETQIHALTQALDHRPGAPRVAGDTTSTAARPRAPRRPQGPTLDAQTPQTSPPHQADNGPTVLQDTEPVFDPARFMLGPLCQKQHDYDGQGHSLRQLGGKHECVTCKNARSREYKERQRQAKAQA